MTSNIAARAATAGELVKFRGNMDGTKLGLAIQHPATVYTAHINGSPASLDGVAELIYDGGAGTLADVLPGMTVFIGSSSGAYDKGICRVRKTPTATSLYINQTSDIVFADNDYITVLNSFSLWQRDTTVTAGIVAMDYDVAFGAYTNGGVIPRVGPIAAVLKRVGGTVTFTPPSPAQSAGYDGATIVSYLYAFPGSASSGNLTDGTGTAYATYTSAGEYRWSVSITDSIGRTTTTYRWVFVDPSEIEFNLNSCSGDYQSGDWSFEVTAYADVTRASVYDRALCVLYADDYYQNTAGSIGKISGYENILCVGWIDGESISFDSESGEVSFTVRGAGHWLSKIRAFPFEISDTSSAPTNFKQITEMTVDKALAHLLFWTSTAWMVMDCFFSGDTTRLKIVSQPAGSLLTQLNAIAANTIFAKPLINNYGQMYIEIDPQIIPDAVRDTLPVVMDITTQDRLDGLEITRSTSSKAAMLELGAVSDYDGTTSALLYSRAPGVQVGKAFGDIKSYNNYVIFDQDECNRISGCLLATENNPYEPVEINLGANNRLFDIAPRMYATLSISAGDTPRGIAITSARLIPRKVNFEYDKTAGVLSTSATFEFESIGADGVTYVPPSTDMDNFGGFDTGLGGGMDFPSLGMGGWFPETVPPEVSTPCDTTISNSFSIQFDILNLYGDQPATLVSKCYFPCMLRSTGSTIRFGGLWYLDANTHYNVYGIKGGARVISATVSAGSYSPFTGGFAAGGPSGTATFTPLSNTEVDGFELELTAGLGSSIFYVPLNAIYSGTVDATNSAGSADNALVIGQHYAVEGAGGPWVTGYGVNPQLAYTIAISLNSGSVWSQDLGTRQDVNGGPYVYHSLPSIPNEQFGAYGRAYYTATTTKMRVRAAATIFYDNSGTMGWVIRNAEAIGRRIELTSAVLNDVCAIGT